MNYQVINLSTLEEFAGGSKEFSLEMIDLFLEQMPECEENLPKHLRNQDWHNLKELAHKMKSTFSLMGASALQENMLSLELDVRQDRIDPERFNTTINATLELIKNARIELEHARNNYLP